MTQPRFSMRALFIFTLLALLLSSSSRNLRAADSARTAARQFLDDHAIYSGATDKPEHYGVDRQKIAATADPQSKFGYIVFSVARHSKTLLAPQQIPRFDKLIQDRQQAEIKWHDVRNIVRIHTAQAMWRYALASPDNPEQVVALRGEWQAWTELREAFMFQEFVDKERFQRAAWDLLIPAQHDAIRSGEWDKYLKRDTGHKRLFSADKQVTRVFGKPQDSAQFDAAVDKWKNLWQPMWDRYQAASLFQCQREFAMDRADESFAIYSWSEYATEFRDFVTTECAAIREIIQTGYSIDDDLLSKSEALHEKLRADMLKKYRPEQDDFLRSLGTLD